MCIIERLFSSSLVAMVELSNPRKLRVCHFKVIMSSIESGHYLPQCFDIIDSILFSICVHVFLPLAEKFRNLYL